MRDQGNILSQFSASQRLELLDFECFYQLYIFLKDNVGWKDEEIRLCIVEILNERRLEAQAEAHELKRREEEALSKLKELASMGNLTEEIPEEKAKYSSPYKKQIPVERLAQVDEENLHVMTSTFPFIEGCLRFRGRELESVDTQGFPNPANQDADALEKLYAIENKRFEGMQLERFEYPRMTLVLNRVLRFLRELLPERVSQLKDLITRKYLGEVLREMNIGGIFGERALEGRCIRSASVITKSVAE